jgi:hypothetical protein
VSTCVNVWCVFSRPLDSCHCNLRPRRSPQPSRSTEAWGSFLKLACAASPSTQACVCRAATGACASLARAAWRLEPARRPSGQASPAHGGRARARARRRMVSLLGASRIRPPSPARRSHFILLAFLSMFLICAVSGLPGTGCSYSSLHAQRGARPFVCGGQAGSCARRRPVGHRRWS